MSIDNILGKTVTVSVNGNTVKIPVDGKFYDVSEAHNHQLQKKLNGVERNIQRNLQQAPNTFGETGDWAPAMFKNIRVGVITLPYLFIEVKYDKKKN